MLEGVVQRGTGRKLKYLNLNLAGKTGTTNNNTDTWFIGFTSKLVVGVYVGFDEPASLGRYETGGKTAMPIFKKFILNSISKQDATPFKVPDGIVMMVVDPATGQKVDFNSKNSIYESFKEKNLVNLYKLNKRLSLGLLFLSNSNLRVIKSKSKKPYVKFLGLDKSFLSSRKIDLIKKPIYYYTIKNKNLFHRYKDSKNLIFENL